jgi:hypothetical protein
MESERSKKLNPWDVWDTLVGLGALCVAGGAAWIYRPAGLIVFGIVLVVWGILGASVGADRVGDSPRQRKPGNG